MKEIFGNAWELFSLPNFNVLCVTTNGFIKANGTAVMGRGIACQAKEKYPELPRKLAENVCQYGNVPSILKTFPDGKILASFPVKHSWFEEADLKLIAKSCEILMSLLEEHDQVLLPRPGCGNGRLNWDDVKPVIEKILDDRVHIVHWKKGETQ